jgi:hypothetical protein
LPPSRPAENPLNVGRPSFKLNLGKTLGGSSPHSGKAGASLPISSPATRCVSGRGLAMFKKDFSARPLETYSVQDSLECEIMIEKALAP